MKKLPLRLCEELNAWVVWEVTLVDRQQKRVACRDHSLASFHHGRSYDIGSG